MKIIALIIAVTAGVLAIVSFAGFEIHRADSIDRTNVRGAGQKLDEDSATEIPVALTDMAGKDSAATNTADQVAPAEPEPAKTAASDDSKLTGNDTIVIPGIDSVLPIVTATTTDTAKLHALLDSGVVLYPSSAGFGQVGQTILLGHSAPPNWPKIKQDTAFSRIDELAWGSVITVNYSGKIYQYEVVRTLIVDKGVNLPEFPGGGNSLLLVSCWPPGRNLQRIVVEARLDLVR